MHMSFFLIIRVLVPEFIMIFMWIMLQGFVVLTNTSLPRDSQHSGLSMSIILWFIAIICIVVGLKRLASASRSKFPLPPGPPADPFIGHLRHIPSDNPEDIFSKWSKQYGMDCEFKFATVGN